MERDSEEEGRDEEDGEDTRLRQWEEGGEGERRVKPTDGRWMSWGDACLIAGWLAATLTSYLAGR